MHQTRGRFVPCFEKRHALLRLLLDSHALVEDVNINASLWKQLAACVFLQSFWGNLRIEKASVRASDYREAQLRACAVRPLIA